MLLFDKQLFFSATGFVGVYIAGHILETTKSWNAVFGQTAVVCMFGWVVFAMFGTGKKVI